MNIKKNIFGFIRAAIFITIVVLIFIWLSNVFTPRYKSAEDGLSSQISNAYRGEDKNSIDVMLVGNSDIYRAYSPVDLYKETGITSVVSGCPKLTVEQGYNYVKDMLKYQHPKVVVLDTDCFYDTKNPGFVKTNNSGSGSGASTESSQKESNNIIKRTSLAFKGLKKKVKSADGAITTKISFYYPLFKLHSDWYKLSSSNFKDYNSSYKYSNKGMAYESKTKPYNGGYSYMGEEDMKPTEILPADLESFKKICELCKENDISLALVTVPSAISWNYGKHYAMENLAKENGLTYTDYNYDTLDSFDWKTDSKDGGDHLNYKGALKITKALGELYRNVYGLKATDLTDKQKDIWNEDYTYFHENIVKA